MDENTVAPLNNQTAQPQEGPTALWDHLRTFLAPEPVPTVEASTTPIADVKAFAESKAVEAGKREEPVVKADPLDAAWARVLKAEGGYTVDTGGETMYGISKNAYPHLDIKSVTPEMAKEIYKKDYYDKVGGDTIGKINPDLAEHVADMAFNAGPGTAVKILYQSVGLPPQKKITEELIDKLSSDDGAVVGYSRSRLAYYADLATSNPEKYGKYLNGWTNRVKNLNKELGFTKGMEPIYAAARAGNSESLRAVPTLQPLAGQFNELSQEERAKIRAGATAINPAYAPKKSSDLSTNPDEKDTSGLGEVIKATYRNQYYLNTRAGAAELQQQANKQAVDENIKKLGDKFTPKMKTELMVQDIADQGDYFDNAMKIIRKHFPDEALPFSDRDSVQNLLHENAARIEKEYVEVNSGNFSDGIGASANKLFHILAGYLPGSLAGLLNDPISALGFAGSAAVGAATGGASIAAQAGAMAASTFAFEGIVNQPGVQSARENLGLNHGFTEGLTNATTSALFAGALQGIGAAVSKALTKSSAEAAAELSKAAKAAKETADNIPDKTTKDFVIHQVSDAEDVATIYQYNPHGTGAAAKAQLDADIKRVAEDLASGQPLREASSPPINNMPLDPEAEKAINTILGKGASSEYEWYRRGFLSEPVTFDEGKPILFPSKAAAEDYVSQRPESSFSINKRPGLATDDWYVMQHTDDAAPTEPAVSDFRPKELSQEILDEETARLQKRIDTVENIDTDQAYIDTLNKVRNQQNHKLKELFDGDEELQADLDELGDLRQDMKQLKACMTGGE